LTLKPLDDDALLSLCKRTLKDKDRGLGGQNLMFSDEALSAIIHSASGDGRRVLSALGRVAGTLPNGTELDAKALQEILGETDLLHDRGGDAHYDVASALIKSLRGSDPQGSLYWCARMLEGGEDPMFVARRLVIFAAEDVGNADPRALQLAVGAMQGVHLVGMPEARIILGQAVTYLATAPKSNRSYVAINKAMDSVRRTGALQVPKHLRNAPTSIAKSQGHGEGYQNPHDHPGNIVAQSYLPPALEGQTFYTPTPHGAEKLIGERMKWWHDRLKQRR
jgi:putative ATPase